MAANFTGSQVTKECPITLSRSVSEVGSAESSPEPSCRKNGVMSRRICCRSIERCAAAALDSSVWALPVSRYDRASSNCPRKESSPD